LGRLSPARWWLQSAAAATSTAWLGLVPKQISTGDRSILGKISKRGNRYLRVLFVQAAWVVLIKPQSWDRHGLKPWLEAAKKRLHHNVLAIALANKLARIAWASLRMLEHSRRARYRSPDRSTRAVETLPAEVCERMKTRWR
jgi:transposase